MELIEAIESWKRALEDCWAKSPPGLPEYKSRVIKDFQEGRIHDGDRSIWLCGPGRGHKHYGVRSALRDFLSSFGFVVVFTEDHYSGRLLSEVEDQQFKVHYLTIVLCLSPGSAGEAINFLHQERTIGRFAKLKVFIPSDYKDGYVYRCLDEGGMLPGPRILPESQFDISSPELAIAVYETIWAHIENDSRSRQLALRDEAASQAV